MPEIKIIRGGGHDDQFLPMEKDAENFMFKVMDVGTSNAVLMMTSYLYDDPKWLGYDTANHRATATINIKMNECLVVTYLRGVWTYTGYKNDLDTITIQLGNPKELRVFNVTPDFKEHFGEKNFLEVIMHPADGEEGDALRYLYSNNTLTSPDYEDTLHRRLPNAMKEQAGEIVAVRYGFEPNTIALMCDGKILSKLTARNNIYKEGIMEYRFIPYYTVSDDMQTITIREVAYDPKSNAPYLKETEVIVDDTIDSPYADEYATWCFRAGVSIKEQTSRYGDLVEYFLLRAKG